MVVLLVFRPDPVRLRRWRWRWRWRWRTTQRFSTWSAVDPPQTVEFTGLSQDTLYELIDGGPDFSVTDKGVSTANVTATIRYRSNGTIERIVFSTPENKLSWDEATGDIISNVGRTSMPEIRMCLEFGVFFNPLECPRRRLGIPDLRCMGRCSADRRRRCRSAFLRHAHPGRCHSNSGYGTPLPGTAPASIQPVMEQPPS